MKNINSFLVASLVFLFAAPGFAQADEAQVRAYFVDVPAMIDIARCESSFRQYADSGNVFRGGAGAKMLGVFQLHSDYHLTPSLAMGLDIATLDGNLAYARHLYEREGLVPWTPCLGAVTTASTISAPVTQPKEVVQTDGEERALLIKKVEELQLQLYLLQIKLLQMQLESLSVAN